MKKILFTILLLLIPQVTWGAIAHVQSPAGTDCGTATSCNTAFGSNVTAGNFILSFCRYGTSTLRTVTVTDTRSNTYIGQTLSMNTTNTSDGHAQNVQWSTNIAGGADTVTCAVSGAGTIMRTMVHEFSGVLTTSNTAAQDKMATSSGTGSNPASGAVVPTQDGELLYAVDGNGSSPTGLIAAGTDFTILTRVPSGSGLNRTATEYYVQPTAVSHNGDFGTSQSQWSAGLVTFFAAATATDPPKPRDESSDFFPLL